MTDAPTPPEKPSDPTPDGSDVTPDPGPPAYPTPPPAYPTGGEQAPPAHPSAGEQAPPPAYGPPPTYPASEQQPPAYGAPPAYTPPPYGQPPYGQPPYGQQPYGQQVHPDAYAHWGLRVGAALLDAVILLPFYILLIIGSALFNAGTVSTYDSLGNEMHTQISGGGVAGIVLMGVAYIGMFVVVIWNQVFRQGRTGWSLGKKWVGIRLIDEQTGQPMGAGMCFVRQLCHIVDSITCYIGYLWPLWDQKRQTFADKIMHTVVVPQREQ